MLQNVPVIKNLVYTLEKRHSHVHLRTPLKPNCHHHSKKEKTKKGPKKKKHDDTTKRSPEKLRTSSFEEDGTPAVPEVKAIPEEKLERNIVDQTISVLPEIGEDEILATPPKQGWLSELADPPAFTEQVAGIVDTPKETTAIVDTPKDVKTSPRHRHKHEEHDKKEASPGKSGRHHKHHRHRRKSELQERRRPGAATIKEKDKVTMTEPTADASALDQKDVDDMKCKLFMLLFPRHFRQKQGCYKLLTDLLQVANCMQA